MIITQMEKTAAAQTKLYLLHGRVPQHSGSTAGPWCVYGGSGTPLTPGSDRRWWPSFRYCPEDDRNKACWRKQAIVVPQWTIPSLTIVVPQWTKCVTFPHYCGTSVNKGGYLPSLLWYLSEHYCGTSVNKGGYLPSLLWYLNEQRGLPSLTIVVPESTKGVTFPHYCGTSVNKMATFPHYCGQGTKWLPSLDHYGDLGRMCLPSLTMVVWELNVFSLTVVLKKQSSCLPSLLCLGNKAVTSVHYCG